jgi:hypothetical protein
MEINIPKFALKQVGRRCDFKTAPTLFLIFSLNSRMQDARCPMPDVRELQMTRRVAG